MNKLINDSPRLMSDNLSRIERLPRRALLLFLDMERSKSSTFKLRSRARTKAVSKSDVSVDMDLTRAESIAAGGLS